MQISSLGARMEALVPGGPRLVTSDAWEWQSSSAEQSHGHVARRAYWCVARRAESMAAVVSLINVEQYRVKVDN